jgi:hypothetical protein
MITTIKNFKENLENYCKVCLPGTECVCEPLDKNDPYNTENQGINLQLTTEARRQTTEIEQSVMMYLNDLRDSGDTNMYEAVPYILDNFIDVYNADELNIHEAKRILSLWMKNFSNEANYSEINEAVKEECYILVKDDNIIKNFNNKPDALKSITDAPEAKKPSQIHSIYKLVKEQKIK